VIYVTDTCYLSAIPKAGSEPVISFLNRANPFDRVCLFCNFVRNKIYVTEIEMLEPVFMARYLKFEDITFYNLLHDKQNCITTG
jgi:hypothetical protein